MGFKHVAERTRAVGVRIAQEPRLVWRKWAPPGAVDCDLGPPGPGPLNTTETLLLASRAQVDAP